MGQDLSQVSSGSEARITPIKSEAGSDFWLYLSGREMGMNMAEIARNLGVSTSPVAMAIKKEESGPSVVSRK
jgi:hypothetical protein